MEFTKRSLMAVAGSCRGRRLPMPAAAADMIGNCELSGQKGSIPIAKPAKPGQLTVEVSLPAPIWWNGDTPESIKDGMEYCMAAEIAWRAGYDKMEVVNVGWDPLVTGQTADFDLALSQISITDERKKVVDFSIPYFSSDIGVLVRADTPVDEKTIKEKTVGVQQATTGAAFAMDTLKITEASQVYPEQGDMFTALTAGQIDAAMTDTSIVLAEELKIEGQERRDRPVQDRRDLWRDLSQGRRQQRDDRQDHPVDDRRRHHVEARRQISRLRLGQGSGQGSVLQSVSAGSQR